MPIDDMLARLADDLVEQAHADGRPDAYQEGIRDTVAAVRHLLGQDAGPAAPVRGSVAEVNWVTAFAIGIARRREPEPADVRAAVDIAGADVDLLEQAARAASTLEVLDAHVRQRVAHLLEQARDQAAHR